MNPAQVLPKKCRFFLRMSLFLIGCLLALAVPIMAQVNGAIYTTDPTGTQVNGNIYPDAYCVANNIDGKPCVYMSGGPQNKNASGLSPNNTLYYFMVTDPSGSFLLSQDDIHCRVVLVDSSGRIAGVPADDGISEGLQGAGNPSCYHARGGTDANGGTVVQLCSASGCASGPAPQYPPGGGLSFYDTPNPGGEYKAWITPVAAYVGLQGTCATGNLVFGFCDSQSKTDNFKAKKPGKAYVTACKFNDLAGTGIYDPANDPLLPHWPVTATGVDGGTVNVQTDDNGCVSFSISTFSGSTQTVTLSEGTQGPDWAQTAPPNGSCTLLGNNGTTPSTNDSCSVAGGSSPASPSAGGVITLTVSPGDDVLAPYFGNTNPFCNTTGCNGSGLVVTKDANTSYKENWNIRKAVANTTISDSTGTATFNYTVAVNNTGASNWMVTGTIRVSNPTSADVNNITVSDALNTGSNGICTVSSPGSGPSLSVVISVAAGSHVDVPYSCTYPVTGPSPTSGTNTATAITTGGTFVGTQGYDFATATVADTIVAVSDSLGTLGTVSIDPASGNITAMANPGNPGVTATPTTPTPSVPGVFSYSFTFSGDPAGTCTNHPNTATFTTNTTGATGNSSVTPQQCVGADLTVSKTANPSFTRTYNWTIAKSGNPGEIDTSSLATATFTYMVTASETGFTDGGWQVTGSITVTNPNNWEAITASVTDAIDNGGNCTVSGGTNVSVAPGQSVTLNYTCTYASAPSSPSFTNRATATWDKTAASTPDASAWGPAIGSFASVTPTKVNATITPTDAFNSGSAVRLCILDTNSSAYCTLTATDTTPYTTHTYSYSRTVTAPTATCSTYPNTASTGLTGTGQTSSASIKVCGASPLTVSKTANGSFSSRIAKSVNKTTVQQSGGNITFNYTVTVTESGWTVSGSIMVTNPNNWESITATVTDALTDLGGVCSVTGGTNVSVGLSSTVTLPYTCTFAARPTATSGINTATATWSASTAHTSVGSAPGMANYSFSPLTVTDNLQSSAYPLGCTATLGTASAIATAPSTSPGCGVTSLTSPSWGVFTYSITDANAAPASCASYNNTAQITGGSASSPVTVTVCNTNTGALTMGFWKNTNGQKVITSYCGGASGTSLMAYLSSFNPFMDDTATTCAQEATYVAGVIGGATCSSGGTCNTMLRAQMLATALDVYFSTPSLGGNAIGAYNGLGNKTPMLGNVVVNLSGICSMADSSGGTGSCTNTYEDARPEFGIIPTPSCQGTTVSDMLAYSDFPSSANGNPVASANTGATWYQQVKAKQVIAKDGFDNINNNVANIATTAACGSTF